MNSERKLEECWHWFHGLMGISQKEKEILLKICPEVEKWHEFAKKKTTAELFIYQQETQNIQKKETPKQKERREQVQQLLESDAQRIRLQSLYEIVKEKNIKLCLRESKEYPQRLKQLEYSPFLLYYYGKLPKDTIPSLAIIGARNCSTYGEEVASVFSRELSKEGIQVISGMARGIDSAAQRSAIKEKGSAYAVLGSGVDICYPRENKILYEDLCLMGGVISEELPGTAPLGKNFPKRNRLISGLSDAVFIVEAREKSGSLITASYALEQGKDIYAIPGRIYERLAEGTNRLIQEGAYLVREPKDILQGFQSNFKYQEKKIVPENSILEKNKNLLLETNEKIVYACLGLQEKHIEQIYVETGISMSELTSLLFNMEMKHYIKQPLKNYYTIYG